jgi:hypothetical protein
MKNSVGHKSKEHFLDLGIDSVLLNALMCGTYNIGL